MIKDDYEKLKYICTRECVNNIKEHIEDLKINENVDDINVRRTNIIDYRKKNPENGMFYESESYILTLKKVEKNHMKTVLTVRLR